MNAEYKRDLREERCVYTLAGYFDLDAANALQRSVEGLSDEARYLVIDLRKLTGYTEDARRVFVTVHGLWAARSERIAYLATEPRFRGLSLWIMHMAGDDQAIAVGSEAQVDAWLKGTEGRQEQAWNALGVQNGRRALKRRQELGSVEKVATRAIGWMMQLAFGFHPSWMDEVIKTHGIAGLKRFSDAVQSSFDELTEHYGELNSHVIMAVNALWNGCHYCSYGHLLAMNLLYFRQTGRLSPLSEHRLLYWQQTEDRAIVDEILCSLSGDQFAVLNRVLRVLFDMRLGRPVDPELPVVKVLSRHEAAWALINECSIVEDEVSIPPLDPKLVRNRGLLRSYRRKRAQSVRNAAS